MKDLFKYDDVQIIKLIYKSDYFYSNMLQIIQICYITTVLPSKLNIIEAFEYINIAMSYY